MSIRIVRLGEKRAADEGTRIGTVRRPPRGVAKRDFARLDYYDVWLPLLAPSPATLKAGLAVRSEREWAAFARKYRAEMRAPAPRQALDVLATLSRHANFSVGCYCQEERRCHRSLLRELLVERGASVES
jgi:uncharacterized protein YeaO (DUF488 family)